MDSIKLSRIERDPQFLLRMYIIQGIATFLLILCFTGFGIYRSAVNDVLKIAVDDSIRISKVMVVQRYADLFAVSEQNVTLDSSRQPDFDRRVREFLHPFGIVKIKIFNLDKLIIYSTDRNIIGKLDDQNQRLPRALDGAVDSHQETKDQFVDLAEEQRFDVDVVETYVPIRNQAGQIAGVFEIYLDVTQYRQEIHDRVQSSLAILAVILLVMSLCSFIFVSIGIRQLKNLLNRLHHMVLTDHLTGIFNRRAVMTRAEEELSRLDRLERLDLQASGGGLGLIMIDLDHFKEINDSYGHQVGDGVLRELAGRIQSCLRDYDVFGRYGGEEFLIIAPGTSQHGVIGLARRIHHRVIEQPFVIGDKVLDVTASFGVTSCFNPSEGINAVLRRADMALYQAKKAGRNQVASS